MSSSEQVKTIGIVGLGYVGLPLAVALARHYSMIGVDVHPLRVQELQRGYDRNGEAESTDLNQKPLLFTTNPGALREANLIIVTVPTPVDRARQPDLSFLESATRMVGAHLKKGVTVVYESTVYPGCTEEFCVPILEEESGMRCGTDFYIGYSPERVNPGDPQHTLERIVKVVSAGDPQTLEILAEIYKRIVPTGIHKAPNIRTAEAAKVIENIQRDLNIALMNELSMLFHRMGLDTREILQAAKTKWNFLPFEPGLVGGHCIPVDPYYLTYKTQELGFHPEVILAGRRINDGMGRYVAMETVRLLARTGKAIMNARVLVMGVTFKEDVRDTRNSRSLDLIHDLMEYGFNVRVHDPMLDVSELSELGLDPVRDLLQGNEKYDVLVLAVPHRLYRETATERYLDLLLYDVRPGVILDVRAILDPSRLPREQVIYWRL